MPSSKTCFGMAGAFDIGVRSRRRTESEARRGKIMRRFGRFLVVTLFVVLTGGLFAAAAAEHPYVGSDKCKPCHIKEWKSWSETKMANVFDVLKPGERTEARKKAGLDPNRDYTHDTQCLQCHTTGYGKPGGFQSIETTPRLAGVGCEMCHGPGGTYTQPQYMSLVNKEFRKSAVVAMGLVGTIEVKQCEQCHNKKSPFVGDGYVFDFEANKKKGTHEKFPLKFNHGS